MKTTLKLIIAALAAITAFASCQKENAANNGNPSTGGVRVLTLSFDSGTKATLNGLQPEFIDGEYVRISNGTDYEDKTISVAGGVATIETTLSGTLTAVIPPEAAKMDGNKIDGVIIPASQTGVVSDTLICMATGAADATSLHFKGQTSLFIVTPPTGVRQFEIQSTAAINSEASPDNKCITVGNGYTYYHTYYVSLLPGVSLNNLKFVAGSVQKTISSTAATAANTAYTITNSNWLPEGALSGAFSVSATKKVHFSQGNLRYTTTSNTWSFFDNQYDCGPSFYSEGHNKVISLFTWGYNATKSIIPDGQDSGNVSRTSGNLTQSEDWGSQIGDGNTWRTLTSDEWQYLFATRIMTNGKDRYSIDITYGGMKGLVLYPDDYDNAPISGTVDTLPEGVVFLPAAGYRDGSFVREVGYSGVYWSSSTINGNDALGVFFNGVTAYAGGNRSCRVGFSVRLVTKVE